MASSGSTYPLLTSRSLRRGGRGEDLGDLSQAGGPALTPAIAEERARTPLGQFAGKTMEQARAQLVWSYFLTCRRPQRAPSGMVAF